MHSQESWVDTIRLRNMTSVYFVAEDGLLCLYRIGSRVADRLHVGAAGGHFEEAELNDPCKCIFREIREELGISEQDIDSIKLRYITHRIKDGEIRQNYYYFAELKIPFPVSSTEGDLCFVSWEELSSLAMPISARHMMDHYLRVGRFDDILYGGITQASGTQFVPMEEF